MIDHKGLSFSTERIQYGNDHYPVSALEAVAIYLYVFENFEYRDGFVDKGGASNALYVRAHGDRNKISFRSNGTVLDFDFYIDDFARFIIIKKVVNDWIAQGVNVALKQAF